MGILQNREASPDRLVPRARVIELIIRKVYLLQREPHRGRIDARDAMETEQTHKDYLLGFGTRSDCNRLSRKYC
jgi:hypothetical protein